ncbi:MAG: DUF262 domain-containing protein [Acidobacteriaceae bacterium]
MNVSIAGFTIAEYCQQMENKTIVVNREYQRSDKAWPSAARSYLIDSILSGYPIPKLSLYQKTDLTSRKTIKEIVDGQQRSQAIFDFLHDKFQISGKSEFAGRKFSTLEQTQQQQFLDYQLTADLFVGATTDEIRQTFRRINSYTIPLNPQEKRHAVFQGEFKWFIVDLSEKYADVLKLVGLLSERQLSRMADAALFSELSLAMLGGIQSASEPKIDQLYEKYEKAFGKEEEIRSRFVSTMDVILRWEQLHNTVILNKLYNFYSLFLAITHACAPLEVLNTAFPRKNSIALDPEFALPNITELSEALTRPEEHQQYKEFIQACSKTTNRLNQRVTRFQWFSKALDPQLFS